MKPLIPHFIAERFQANEQSGSFEAWTMFLDLSGFTAMTEQLVLLGNVGAEQLSTILNNIFEPLVSAVYAKGGFIPYFAGDAFTAIFPKSDNNHIDATSLTALAGDFIQRFGAHQYSDEFIIKCKIGLSCGNVEWGIVGDSHKNFYFRGDAIEQCAMAQTHAEAQEIVVDATFVANCTSLSDFENINGIYYRYRYIYSATTGVNTNTVFNINELDENVGKLFLPNEVIEFNQAGEFREIVSVFISFKGVSTHEEMNDFSTIVLNEIQTFSGYFKEIDFGDKGGVMLAFFGAPIAHENNNQRALEFALSILESTKALPVQCSIGMTSGMAYIGMIGGRTRCQYAAVGNRVNLAARLMSEAQTNEILADQNLSKIKGFNFLYEGNISYKGISQDVPTYRLSAKKSEIETSFANIMVGRQEELAQMLRLAAPIEQGRFAAIVTLFGEAGIGKSRMAFELKESLKKQGTDTCIICQADQILRKPFNPFIYALKNYFSQSGDKNLDENRVTFEKQYDLLFGQCIKSPYLRADTIIRELIRTKSILAGLLGIVEEDSLWTQLDAKGRYENTLVAINNFFCANAMLRPMIVEIEDGHWLDVDSAAFLPDFIQRIAEFPIFVLITSRYNDDGSKPTFFSESYLKNTELQYEEIDLNILKTDALQDMAELRLGGKIDEAFLEFLYRSSNGNPFYVEQMLEYFSESALLEKKADNTWTVKDKTMKLSSSVNAVLMARVDRLSYLVKETVKAAAVIGREFELPILSEVMVHQAEFIKRNGNSHLLLREQVVTAERSQIWWAMNELRYIFKHSLLREAIYDMQLRARLRELHRLIAEAIEKIYADNIEERYADLAFHYEHAESIDLTIHYLEEAASFARRNYQNRQALEYYGKLIGYYEEQQQYSNLVKILLKKGEIEQLMGMWNDAEATFITARMRASVLNEALLIARSDSALGNLLMLKGQYGQANEYLEKGHHVFERLEDKLGLSKSLGSLGNLNFRQGNYLQAKDYFAQCLDTLRQVDALSINPQIVANLGLTYMNLNDYDEGIHTIQAYLPIAERNNDRQGLASLHTNLGIILFEKGDYDNALHHYEQGLRISSELGNQLLISIAVGSIGSVYERKGDFAKALEHFELDLQLTEALGDKQGIAIAYGLLGSHYSIIGEFAKALSYLEPSLRLCEELNYQKGIIKALNAIGDVYRFQDDFAKAKTYYEKSLIVAQKINNRLLYGLSLIELVYVVLFLKDMAYAKKLFVEVGKAAKILTNQEFQLEYLVLAAAYYRLHDDKETANQYIQKALELPKLSTEEDTAIYYELAMLNPDAMQWKQRVSNAYQALFEKTPKYLYQYKIRKINS